MKRSIYLVSLTILLGISSEALHFHARPKSASDKAAIEALYKEFNDAFNKKDADAIMAVYAKSIFVFDALPPRQYPTWEAYKKDWEGLFAAYPGPLSNTVSEMDITVVDSVAYTHYIDDGMFTAQDGSKTRLVARTTDVLRKSNGKWLIVQEHVSFPVDLTTGKADLLSKP